MTRVSSVKAIGAIGEGLIELAPSGDGLALGFGGDVANVGVMAARLSAPVRLVGRVGADALGDRLLAFWRSVDIDVAHVVRDDRAATGLYVNEPAEDGGHRFTYWRRGSAGSRLAPEDLAPAFFDALGYLVISGVTLAISPSSERAGRHAARRAWMAGAKVACVLNYRPALGGNAARLADLAATSDVVIGSTEDAEAVFGVSDVSALSERLTARPREIVLTDGAAPAVLRWSGGTVRQPVPEMAIRNAAGAGDALAGAYLAARLRGHAPPAALAWGVAASALSVEREGCAISYPTLDETAAVVSRLPPAEEAVPAR